MVKAMLVICLICCHIIGRWQPWDYQLKFKIVWRKIFFASFLNISFRQKNITELRVEDDKINVILHDHIILPTKSSFEKELVIELVIAIGKKHKKVQQKTIKQDFASFMFRKNALLVAVPSTTVRFLAVSRPARSIFAWMKIIIIKSMDTLILQIILPSFSSTIRMYAFIAKGHQITNEAIKSLNLVTLFRWKKGVNHTEISFQV